MLLGQATVINAGQRPVYLEYGPCALRLHAYPDPSRSGVPVWRSERLDYACPQPLAMYTLPPGESIQPAEFRTRIPVFHILGDSLPDGRYYFAVAVHYEKRRVFLSAGGAELRR